MDELSKMPIDKVIYKLPRVEIIGDKHLKTYYHRRSKEFGFVYDFLTSLGYKIEIIKLADRRYHNNWYKRVIQKYET